MIIEQKPAFRRVYKKLHDNQLSEVNAAIMEIVENPQLGEEKKGDLTGVRVYKFFAQKQLFLLAYTIDLETMTLLLLGVHENFYRDLKS